MQLCHALVNSYLLYDIPVWGLTYKTLLQKIASYQNKIFKNTNGVNRNHSVSHLYDEVNILKVEDIYKLEVVNIMHSIRNKEQLHNLSAYYSKISQQHTHTTQASSLMFSTPLFRTSKLQQSFIYQGVKIWNSSRIT